MANSKTEEYYQRILDLIDANDVLISTDAKVKNCERIARLCTVLGSYRNCRELKEEYERLAVEEKQKGLERDYQDYVAKYETANSIDSYKRVEILFHQLDGYKDSEQLASICRDRRLKLTAKRNLISFVKTVLVFAAVAGLVLLVLALNRNNPGQQQTTVSNVTKGIRVEWTPQDSVDEYKIYKSAYNKEEKKWTDFAVVATVNDNTYLDENVYPGTVYRYAVIAKGETDNGNYPGYYSQMVRITSREIISVSNETDTSIKVRWSGSNMFTGYQVQYSSEKGSFSKAESKIIEKSDAYSTTIFGLQENTEYYVRVRSFEKLNGVIYYGGWSQTVGIVLSSE